MPALADGDRLLYELGMLMARSRRLVWTAATRRLEEHGHSMLTWVLLAHLEHGPATQREIASAIGQHPAGVSRLVDDLEKQKLVRRRRDEEDRRRTRVFITSSGRAMILSGRPHVVSAIREALSPLTAADRRKLQSVLRKLCLETPCDEKPVLRPRAKRTKSA